MKNPYGRVRTSLCIVCLIGCSPIFSGCESTGLKPATAEQRQASEERKAADRARHEAEEDQRIAKEEQVRAEESSRRARQRQREEAHQLRERYEQYSTAELKLMHDRYLDLTTAGSGRDVNFNPAGLIPRKASDEKNVEKVVEIERELLRRWRAGDAEAKLPEFEESLRGK